METSDDASDDLDQQARFREIGLRAKRRSLREREYQACAVITGCVAYSIFTLAVAMIGFLSSGAIVAAAIPMLLAAGLAYTIYSVWRPQQWRPTYAAAPVAVFVLLEIAFGGWSDRPFLFAVVALGGTYYLQRIRGNLAALPD